MQGIDVLCENMKTAIFHRKFFLIKCKKKINARKLILWYTINIYTQQKVSVPHRYAEHYIAKIIFSNHILQYTGQQYEDFFVSVMTKANPNFQPVKAYGNIGDMKNDGFDRTTGTYYQIFLS